MAEHVPLNKKSTPPYMKFRMVVVWGGILLNILTVISKPPPLTKRPSVTHFHAFNLFIGVLLERSGPPSNEYGSGYI